MLTAISFIVVFGFIVFVHELGHYVMARVNGVQVHEFAIGMGPSIFERKKGDTNYALKWIPIGGYVMMKGEESEVEGEDSFSSKSPVRRFSILVAGAMMNFISAFVLIVLFFMAAGVPTNSVEILSPDSPAAVYGMKTGDVVLSMNGQETPGWSEVIREIRGSEGRPIAVEVSRENEKISLSVLPVSQGGEYKIGIRSQGRHDVFSVLPAAWTEYSRFFTEIFKFFGNIFNSDVAKDVVGPVGLVKVIGDVAQTGVINLLYIAAYVSVNLGIINLLPLPALDGGRIVFVVIEWITGRKVPEKFEKYVHGAGMAALLLLMAFLVVKDVKGLL